MLSQTSNESTETTVKYLHSAPLSLTSNSWKLVKTLSPYVLVLVFIYLLS